MRSPPSPDRDAATADTVDAAETALAPTSTLDELLVQLAHTRQADAIALRLAHARISETLFGTVAAGGLGRFRVLERLGAGGMGVVYSAYDPDLDRGVALKVVHVAASGRDAALAEAKALARLSHPNVVPVYDVGVEDEHVYIVMEHVRGQTLGHWIKERSRPEILDAYRQAGEALAAAHAAGLVHRDFKPDNVIVGDDGRVRVVDFGLACEAADSARGSDERRPAAGTPRFMAPEQAAGAAVTAAADQYSFCIALDESLSAVEADQGPLPRWIAAVLDRGRADAPAARFPSMGELLHALARDPARVRRRRIALGLIALVGSISFVAGRQSLSQHEDVCGGGEAELAAIWTPAAEAAALARIAGLGTYGHALAQRIEPMLREHARSWAAQHRDACLAQRRRTQSVALVDRRMACLARGRTALAEVAEIVNHADAKQLPEVALAVRALPDPAGCADVNALVSNVEPPPAALAAAVVHERDQLERARVQFAAGRIADARAVAQRSVTAARNVGYGALLAEALLVDGQATMTISRNDAVPLLAEATTLGLQVGADALAVEAWARRAYALGTETDPQTALAGVELIEALAERRASARFARALLYNNVGTVELARDHRDRARIDFQRALTEAREVTGPGAIELIGVRNNLALVTVDPARRETLLAEADAELVRLLGADHPLTLTSRLTHVMTSAVRLGPAAELLGSICRDAELHSELAYLAAECWAEVGYVDGERGDSRQAIAALERAVRVGGALEPAKRAELTASLAFWRGDPASAARELPAAIAALPPGDEHWWNHLQRARLQLVLGRAQRALGNLRAARDTLEPAVAELTTILRAHETAMYERRLGRARVELALTLAALGAPSARVAPVAADAVDWLRKEEAGGEELAALERLAAR